LHNWKDGLLKKDLAVNLKRLTNRDKATLGIEPSLYFYHRAGLKQPDKYADASCTMADLFEVNCRCHGYPRLRAVLHQKAHYLYEKVIHKSNLVSAFLKMVGIG
jgi:putative transposase